MKMFTGVGVALVTPFSDNGLVDFPGLQRLVEHNLEGEIDYLVVHGTTGESATLSKLEKRSILDFIIEINNGRVPIVWGVGGNNTAQVAKDLSESNLNGVDGILSVSPYYNKPSQQGLIEHYKTITDSTDLPIILYNVPARTGSNMEAETVLQLADSFSNIVAVKEASCDLVQVMEIIKGRTEDFAVLSGDDALAFPIVCCGGDGLISVVGNAFPRETSSLIRSARNGDLEQAKKFHYELIEIIQQLFADGNPGGIKEVLKYMNVCNNYVRLPLVPVNERVSRKLYELLAESKLLMSPQGASS